MNKKYIRYIIMISCICITGMVYSCERNSSKIDLSVSQKTEMSDIEQSGQSSQESYEKICVHITGCVKNPGVYMLENGCRIYEAIMAAGGFDDGADEHFLNLAEMVYDGQKIRVYSMEETATADTNLGNVSGMQGEKNKLVNINTASKDILMTLPGIGESRAESIISYREKNGIFKSIEEIMQVSGIKEAAFEKIKDYICVK